MPVAGAKRLLRLACVRLAHLAVAYIVEGAAGYSLRNI